MKNLKQNGSGILICLLEIVVGVLLLINPVGFTSAIITVAGVALIIMGVINVIKYFKAGAEQGAVGQYLTRGLISLLAGCFCAFDSGWFIATFPVLSLIYGVAVLIGGLAKVQTTVDMLRLKKGRWYIAAIGAVVSIVCAIVIIKNPFTTVAVMWMFVGISLIVEAVLDAVTLIVFGKSAD